MNYINKGKRDILIFPNFEDTYKIENIRKQYDQLYGIIPPHITLVFPFDSQMENSKLKKLLTEVLKNIKPFEIEMEGVSLRKDDKIKTNYIFLNLKKGQEKILNIHNLIYEKVLQTKLNFTYVPHITLGCTDNEHEKICLNDKFKTIVDRIFVESIGENEESNIEFEIVLK